MIPVSLPSQTELEGPIEEWKEEYQARKAIHIIQLQRFSEMHDARMAQRHWMVWEGEGEGGDGGRVVEEGGRRRGEE